MPETRLPLEASFRQAIDADPRDPVNRLVAADWLEENGRPRSARVQRWIAQRWCYPKHVLVNGKWDAASYTYETLERWRWYRDLFDGKLSIEPWELPASLFDLLASQIWSDVREYHEETRAWADLERALWKWKELP